MQPTPSFPPTAPTTRRNLAVAPPPPPPPPPRRAAPAAGRTAAPHPPVSPVCVTITPWIDPVVDSVGHDPRSAYVERFWLSTLGPTATWLLRRLVDGFDAHPDGYLLDLPVTARSLGLTHGQGHSNAFTKAFNRCVMFGLAHHCPSGYVVRRRVPDVARRNLLRLPDELQQAHDVWLAEAVATTPGVTALTSEGRVDD